MQLRTMVMALGLAFSVCADAENINQTKLTGTNQSTGEYSDRLPNFLLKHFSVSNVPVVEALNRLFEGMNISVVVNDSTNRLNNTVNIADMSATSTHLLNIMADQAGFFYSYNEKLKKLLVYTSCNYEINVSQDPKSTQAISQIVTSMGGTNFKLDKKMQLISFSANREAIKLITAGLNPLHIEVKKAVEASISPAEILKESPVVTTEQKMKSVSDVSPTLQHIATSEVTPVEIVKAREAVIEARPLPTKKVWKLKEGKTIGKALESWSVEEDWKVVWSLDKDWAIPADTTFYGDFKTAASEVIKTLAANGVLIRAKFYDANKTMVVSGPGVKEQ